MTRIFVTTNVFDKQWRALGLSDNDLRELETYLMENPDSGDIIINTGGAVKLRWALPDTGKSGGIRIIYIDFAAFDKIYFLTCYTKSKKDNLTNDEKNIIKNMIKSIKIRKGK